MYTAVPGCQTWIQCTCKFSAIVIPLRTCEILAMSVFSVSFLIVPFISFLFYSPVRSAILHKRPYTVQPSLGVSDGDSPVPLADAASPGLSPTPAGAYTPPLPSSTPLYGASPLPLPASPTNGVVATSVFDETTGLSTPAVVNGGNPPAGQVTPAPSGALAASAPPGCTTYGPCNVFFQVSLFKVANLIAV